MAEKIIVVLYDKDGTPSSGYPVKVSLSSKYDTLSPISQVTDAVTGYSSGTVTVYTDDSGRAPVEITALSASNFKQTGDFATILSSGEVGTLTYELPLSVEVALTDATNSIITPAIIPGQRTLTVDSISDEFAVFNLPEGEYPYPRTLSCVTDDGRLMSYIDVHPERRPGVDFAAGMVRGNGFIYSVNENAVYIPDRTVTSIALSYHIRPFYVDPADVYTLRIYNVQTEINMAPLKSLGQRLNAAVLNGGLISEESTSAIEMASDVLIGPVFRDIQGNTISGTVNFFPDVTAYLWAEYPNVLGETAPVRRVKEILMPNPLHKVQQAVSFVRG